MAFLFGRNKQKVIVDLTKSAKDLLVKIQTVDQLPTQVHEVEIRTGQDKSLTIFNRRRNHWRKS